MGDGSAGFCGDTLSAFTPSECYDAGVLRTGVVFEIASPGASGIAVTGAGYDDTPSTSVLANSGTDNLLMRFTTKTDTVGFRLSSPVSAGQCLITVRYVDASPPTARSVPCPAPPASRWVGLEADRPISTVQVSGGGDFEFVDDLIFGDRPANQISVGRATTSPAAGTAQLPVTVPGIGTTSVGGRGIVGARLDSARSRTHRFEIRARGAAERMLRRKGRVTVRVTVTYRPNQGIATTVVKPVTLVRRR